MISTTLNLVAQLLLTSPLPSAPAARAVKHTSPASAQSPEIVPAAPSRWQLSLRGGQHRSLGSSNRFAMVHVAMNLEPPAATAHPLKADSADRTPLLPAARTAAGQSELRLDASPPMPSSTPRNSAAASPTRPSGPRVPSQSTAIPRPTRWLTAARAAQVVGQALAVQRVSATDQALGHMARRARYAAALPDLRLRGGTSADESLRLNPTVDDPARFTQAGARDLWFDAQFTWHLRGSLFAPEEVAIERLRRQREQDKAELVERVLRALGNWQKSIDSLQEPLLLRHTRLKLRLAALQAAMRLDALTDNWFSRHAPVGRAESTE